MNTTQKTYAITDVILAQDILRNLVRFVDTPAVATLALNALPAQITKGSKIYPLNATSDWTAQIKKINETFGSSELVLESYVLTDNNEPMFTYRNKAEIIQRCNALVIVDENKEHIAGETPYAESERNELVNKWVYRFGNENLKYKLTINSDTTNLCITQDAVPPKKVDVSTLELYMNFRFEDGTTIAKRV